jgi:hypothetical protein
MNAENVRTWLSATRTLHDEIAKRFRHRDGPLLSEILAFLEWHEDFVRASYERLRAAETPPQPGPTTAPTAPRSDPASNHEAA